MRDKGDSTYWAVSLCLTNWQLFEVKSSAGRRDNKTEGCPKADSMQTEGTTETDGTRQRMLANHVCMYK